MHQHLCIIQPTKPRIPDNGTGMGDVRAGT